MICLSSMIGSMLSLGLICLVSPMYMPAWYGRLEGLLCALGMPRARILDPSILYPLIPPASLPKPSISFGESRSSPPWPSLGTKNCCISAYIASYLAFLSTSSIWFPRPVVVSLWCVNKLSISICMRAFCSSERWVPRFYVAKAAFAEVCRALSSAIYPSLAPGRRSAGSSNQAKYSGHLLISN